jgi:Protein of unknown function (DUF3300)
MRVQKSLIALVLIGCWVVPALAQAPLPVPQAPPVEQAPLPGAPLPGGAPAPVPQGAPVYPPPELDRIASPIALYPDPLLAQVLAAATYSDQIPDAARWADAHHYLSGQALVSAMAADRIPWDPSIQALIPFPSVLDMMASSMPWTQEIGSAFLAQPQDVMDAVQRERQKAVSYGYLRTNAQVRVVTGPYVEIVPVNPAYIVVPYYDPLIVYARPRPGFVVGGAIRFGFGITLGAAFVPWGWNATHFAWNTHTVIINNSPWRRTFVNRTTYVHPYTAVPRYAAAAPRVEEHRAIERSAHEREAERNGRAIREEHEHEH